MTAIPGLRSYVQCGDYIYKYMATIFLLADVGVCY